MTGKIKKNKTAYLFLAPYGISFLVFVVIPVFITVFFSFTYNNFFDPIRWTGFNNYIKIFTRDDIFITAFKNTLIFALVTGPVGYLLCFMVAWVINELPNRVRSPFVLIFYSPSIAGSVYTIFMILFSGDFYGMVNGLLMRTGFISEPIEWLNDPQYLPMVVMLCVLWTSMNTGFLAFVAGLKSLDRQFYEAGSIDGIKNRWQELWFITLPLMKPQLLFGAIISITTSFAIHEQTFIGGYPSTDYSAHTLVNHLWDYGTFRFDMGYASTISTVLFILMVGSNKLVNRLLRKVGT